MQCGVRERSGEERVVGSGEERRRRSERGLDKTRAVQSSGGVCLDGLTASSRHIPAVLALKPGPTLSVPPPNTSGGPAIIPPRAVTFQRFGAVKRASARIVGVI